MEYDFPEELVPDDIGIDEYDEDVVWYIEHEVISATFDTRIDRKQERSQKIHREKVCQKEYWIEYRCQERDSTVDHPIEKHR